MSEGRSPVVELDSRRAAVPPPAARATARSGRNRWSWVLLAALAACAVGWLLAAQEGRELASALAASEATLETREAALADATLRLEAYDAHVSRVQERVRALSAELGDLEVLLEAGPLAGDRGAR
jgi:uncharacterized protein HemX